MDFLPLWYDQLQQWSLSGRLSAAAREALLLDGEPQALQDLVSQLSVGNFQSVPEIVLLSNEDINGALGAYAISTGKIYLNADWLTTATQEAVIAVLTEELGHYLDGLLNAVDASGDEGEYFSRMLSGVVLTDSQKAVLRAESDLGAVNVDGNILGAEFAATAPAKEWTRLLGSSFNDSANSIITAKDGSIYLAGNTSGNLDGQDNVNGNAAFITKYNNDGTRAWTKLLGSLTSASGRSVTTGDDGSIYLAGTISGDLDGEVNSGESDAFIIKYSSDGAKIWTKLIGSSTSDFATAATTASMVPYIAGITSGNLDGLTNNGGNDAFVAKYKTDGTKLWTKLLGTSGIEMLSAITTANDGSIYLGGYTYGSLDGQNNSGQYDAFIAKYNNDGTKAWTRLVGSSSF